MKNYLLLFLLLISLSPLVNFAQLQSTWTRCLYYDGGGARYHYDSLGVGPSGFAVRDDGKFYVINMDYEQGYQSIYLLDTLGNQIASYQGIGTYATLQEWDCFGLVSTPGNGCAYIEHYYDFGTPFPPNISYKLMQINSSGSIQTLQTWNYPDVLTRIIPNYHNSYYCRVNGNYLDLTTGITYPDSAIGMGPFINDEFIYSDQQFISRKDINGIVNWSIPASGYSAVAFTERVVYLMGDSLKKIDATTGNEMWIKEIPVSGNPSILSFTDGLTFINGRDVTVVDSSGNIKGQNTIGLTINFPGRYSELSNGSIVNGGTFYSWNKYYREYNRSGFVFTLNEEGRGVIDSTTFYHLGDADRDCLIAYYDDAVIIAAKLGEVNNSNSSIMSNSNGSLVFSADWQQSFGNGLNLKFSDINQDNRIDTNDLNALGPYPDNVGTCYIPHTDTAGMKLYCRLANNVNVAGDTLIYWLIFGNPGDQLDSLYGVSLFTGVSAGPVFYTMQEIEFKNGVIGDTATDLFIHHTSPSSYLTSYVACRTDQQNITISGGDTLATVKCIIDDLNSLPGIFPLFVGAHFISKDGYTIPYTVISDTLNLVINSSEELFVENPMHVYPNPVKDILHLKALNNIIEVKLYDVTGRIVFQSKVNSNEYDLNTSLLNTGIYFLESRGVSRVEIFKVVRE